jgi:hypothetical protein
MKTLRTVRILLVATVLLLGACSTRTQACGWGWGGWGYGGCGYGGCGYGGCGYGGCGYGGCGYGGWGYGGWGCGGCGYGGCGYGGCAGCGYGGGCGYAYGGGCGSYYASYGYYPSYAVTSAPADTVGSHPVAHHSADYYATYAYNAPFVYNLR